MRCRLCFAFARGLLELPRVLGGFSSCLLLLAPSTIGALDKNGVAPQAISLPSGPGSIQGLGESFQPQLNTGGAGHAIPLPLPAGTAGHTPQVKLAYDSGSPNGPFGLGWSLSGAFAVSRNTDRGVPRYVDGSNGIDDDGNGEIDNPEELDVFSGMDLEELVPLADDSYQAESESSFTRYERLGAGWLARRKDGTRFELGTRSDARIEGAEGIFSWLLERIVDLDGNLIEFEYSTDPASPGQKYLRRVRWGQPSAFLALVLQYEGGRPDVVTDFRGGFEVRTALRVSRIDAVAQGLPARADALSGDFDGNGSPDRLIRRWMLEYEAAAPVSLLSRVTQLGCDGVTALPSLELDYSSWTPPENVSALVVQSLGEPAETLNSSSVELCDMNGDALPDLLVTSASLHRVAVNLGMTADGRLEWGPLQAVGNAPSIDIGSSTAHLADATADGLADLMVKVNNTRFLCFDNTSQNSWTPSVPLRNTDTWPKWPFDGAEGVASRSMDVDHNRHNDVLFTSAAGYELWMLLPGGQYARESRPEPVLCEGKMFRFDLPGTHVADLNGDRLQDLVWVQASRVVWFPSLGRGRFGEARFLPIGVSLAASDIEKSGFSDIDDDGLMDLTIVRPAAASRSILYWLNRFESGFDGPRRLDGLPALVTGDALRWADMNGNGSSDIVISSSTRPPGSRVLFIELVPDGKPHVLVGTDNGLGVRTTLEHETSVDQMVRARREGRPWSSVMQMSIPVIRRITEDDGLGVMNIREITYRDPYWDPDKQEFRGFRAAQLREVGDDTASDRITRHLFDAGTEEDCLKGKLLLDEVLDETGKVYSRKESAWTSRAVALGTDGRSVCFAFARSTETVLIEGVEAAVTTRVESDFDDYGNPTLERNLGRVDEAGDEVTASSEYDLRPSMWIMDRLSRKRTLDGAGRTVAEQRLHYDARGHLELQEAWLDTENRYVPTLRNRYDGFGNIVGVTDANGHRRSLAYDALLHAHTVSETVHLEDRDLVTTAAHDLGFGVVTASTDHAGAETRYEYDALGRIVRTRQPGGGGELYAYLLGAPISRTAVKTIEDAGGNTHDSFIFSDGYGRQLAKKIEDASGKWRVLSATEFNSRKLQSRRWLSWTSDTDAWEAPDTARPHTTERFDAQGRSIEKRLADGALQRTVHEPLVVHIFDGNDTLLEGTPETQRLDGLGRITAVIQRLGEEELVTRYEWTTQGDLLRIIDAQGNVRTMAHDSLRRLISQHDADGGYKSYEHDDVGNVVRTIDADGATVEYAYDAANRLLTEDQVETAPGEDPIDVRYRYDTPSLGLDLGDGATVDAAFTAGRLAQVSDPSGEEHLSYDPRGNTVLSSKRILDPRLRVLSTFATLFEHDLMDRVIGVTYPDGDRVRYIYGDSALLGRIDGGDQGRVIVAAFGYSETGQLARVEWGNGVVNERSYDSRDRLRSNRLTRPGAQVLLDDLLDLDAVSNVTRISDLRSLAVVPRESSRRRTASFLYDDLHRLLRVRYDDPDAPSVNRGQIDYAYDGIGNMLSQRTPPPGQPGHLSAGGHLVFGDFSHDGGRSGRPGRGPGDPPGPHAMTRAPDGRSYDYDARGNVVGIGSWALAWDARNRLVSLERDGVLSSVTHDHAGRRTIETVTGGGQDRTTYWVNQWFEVRPGSAPIKYVFNGERRVARVKGAIDPTRSLIQRFLLAPGWNPVVAAVGSTQTLAEVFGADARFRIARGRSFTPVDGSAALPVGQALLVLVETPRAAAVRGRYEPPAGPFLLSDTEGYAAWPLLEPLLPVHLVGPARLHVLDPGGGRWSFLDASLPPFLAGARRADSASAIWVARSTSVQVDPRATASEDVLFYHEDHLGSVIMVTDQAGALVSETLHAPYGAELAVENSGSSRIPHGFTGMERDADTGLDYFGARFYDPSIGRFLSVDPRLGETHDMAPDELKEFLADPRKLMTYAYAGDNPLTFIDRDGKEFDVVGPRAQEFVDMLGRLSGLDLELGEGGRVTIDPDGLMDPTVSPTLQNLVSDIIDSDNLVRITAVNKSDPDFFVDTFHRNAGINPARTVHMSDFREIERHMPELASPFVGHVLAEYLHAARPRGRPVSTAFQRAHEHAFRVESQIASEVVGRRLWSPQADRIRPSDYFTNGNYVVDYGPELRYAVRFHAGTSNIRRIVRLPSRERN